METKTKAYNGLENFSKTHRFLIRIYLAYLFLIPGISMFMHDQNFDRAPGWTFFTCLIVITIHLGFVINNFYVPATSLRTLFLIIRLPLEILIFSLFQHWSAEIVLTSLYAFELVGFAIGLTSGTLFRKAPIKLMHRLVSLLLAVGISYTAIMRFSGMTKEIFESESNIWLSLVMLIIGIVTATIPYAKMFIGGQDDAGLNMGNSTLTQRLGKYLAIAMLINLTMMILGINL